VKPWVIEVDANAPLTKVDYLSLPREPYEPKVPIKLVTPQGANLNKTCSTLNWCNNGFNQSMQSMGVVYDYFIWWPKDGNQLKKIGQL
jgi:hypothetical protein